MRPSAGAVIAPQQTLARAVTVAGAGLHTGRRCRITLHPAEADCGRRVVAAAHPGPGVPMDAAHRVPSVMSTSIALGDGRTVRTVEHLMAGLSAYGIDNLRVAVEGPEIPILDGSARPWCRLIEAAGLRAQEAPRRVLRVLKPVQIRREGGFLRAEPADGFSVDMTYDLLPDWPVMRWSGAPDRAVFVSELAAARSFGRLDWRALLGRPRRRARPPGAARHAPDPRLLRPDEEAAWETRLAAAKAANDPGAPVLRGARPGRAALVVGRTVLPTRRLPDEPLRHVVLDMLGDLALAGAPLLARIVAHNPSHEKTYMLVAALMEDPSAWTFTVDSGAAPHGAG